MKKSLTSIFRPRFSEKSGIALILTLAIIALVTLLLIAFVSSMRVENTASKSFNDVIKAREIAQGAVDQAVATIRQATTRDGVNILDYVTFPGAIYDYNGAATTRVPLYSVNPNPPDTTNLNSGSWITAANGEFSPAGGNDQFNVGWLYVAEDGTVGPSPLVNHGAIVGRFAFWTDDEASKINLGTAGAPSVIAPPIPPLPDFGFSAPNEVDLSTLLPTPYLSVPAVIARQATPGYTTPEEVKVADPSDSDFTANQFSLTTYSNDANYPNYSDELDTFGIPRRPLFGVNGLNQAMDIDNTTPANSNAIVRLSDPATIGKLYGGATFDVKYPLVGTVNGLKQVIANIIAYQIDPTASGKAPPDGGGTPPVYLGLAKTPYINEVQITYAVSGAAPSITVQRTISVELFYIYDTPYTTAPVLGNEQIRLNSLPTAGGAFSAGPVLINIPASTTFNSGSRYTVVTFVDPTTATLTAPTTIPTQTAVDGPTRVEYFRKNPPIPVFNRLDYSEMMLTTVTLDPTIAAIVYQDAEANDPAVNDTDNRWTKNNTIGTLGGGLGAQNIAYAPPADISKVVMRGAPMQSVGELGYIHRPEPWLHLTLQPGGGAAAGQIPDWAILDAFTVGNTTIPNVTAGRININSFINPGLTVPAPFTHRLVPLTALLNSIVTPPVVTVADAIYGDSRADTYGMKDPATTDPIYDTIGEVCEILSLANGQTTDAGKEQVIRRIGNLITTRSSTFTIWVMAQSIKQPPANLAPGTFNPTLDLITGEVRAQAVVERYESTPGVAGSVPKFRTRYFRYLYN